MDEGTLRKLLESSLAAEKDKLNANDVKDVNDKNYCPGHVDLYVKVTLAGFDDKNGLRTIPLDLEENSDKASDWDGWTEEQVENVEKLIAQDWFKTYGLTISTINPKKPLTEEEVSKYMADLPEDVSEERKAVIKFALQSVGKIPYYWGGKAAKKNYEGNGFGKVIGADYKGRVLRGLDCSGWVQWVYWSAIGNNLHEARSTASLIGEGEKIKRADLKPGDVIVRIGADSHVVMFLQWAGNGNMIAIHENSAANTVSVNEVTANYPYYRRLIA
jgi:cell wall-associated NlpC family hydrolase